MTLVGHISATASATHCVLGYQQGVLQRSRNEHIRGHGWRGSRCAEICYEPKTGGGLGLCLKPAGFLVLTSKAAAAELGW